MTRIARVLAKWLGVPIALAAIGYFVIGPRVGNPPDKVKKPVEDIVANVENRIHPRAPVSVPPVVEGSVAPIQTSSPAPRDQSTGAAPRSSATHTAEASDGRSTTSNDGPQVEVSVDGASTDRPVNHRSTHHRKKLATPKPPTKPKPDQDDGSYGGTQDAGKTAPPPDGN